MNYRLRGLSNFLFLLLMYLLVAPLRLADIRPFEKENRFPPKISEKLDEYWNAYKVRSSIRNSGR